MKKKMCLLLASVVLLSMLVACGGREDFDPGDIPTPGADVSQSDVDASEPIYFGDGDEIIDYEKLPPENDERHSSSQPSNQKFKYEWQGEVWPSYALVKDASVTEWFGDLYPWWVLTDVDAPMDVRDGYQLYAVGNRDRVYPAILPAMDVIDMSGMEAYTDGLSSSVKTADGGIRYTYTVFDDGSSDDNALLTKYMIDFVGTGSDIWTEGEYLISKGHNALANTEVLDVQWVRKFDTGKYFICHVQVKGEENFDEADDFCQDVIGIDINDMMSRITPHVLTYEDKG